MSTVWDILSTVGVILITAGRLSTLGDIMISVGGISAVFNITSPHSIEHPHSTEHTFYGAVAGFEGVILTIPLKCLVSIGLCCGLTNLVLFYLAYHFQIRVITSINLSVVTISTT